MLINYGLALDEAGRYKEAALQFKKAMEMDNDLEVARKWGEVAREREGLAKRIREEKEKIQNRQNGVVT